MKYLLLFLVSYALSTPCLVAQCTPYEHPSMVWFTGGGAYGEWLTVEIRAPVCRAGSPFAIAYGFGITTLTGPLMLVPPVGVAGSGTIDATGRGVARLAIPNAPSLLGLPVHFQGGITGGYRVEIASMLIAAPAGRRFQPTWRDTTLPDFPYPGHARATLAGGQVLITGGKPRGLYLPGPGGYPPITTMRLYDPIKGTMTPAGNMLRARFGHAIVPLPDGTALIVGGDPIPQSPPAVAELYKPGNPINLSLGTVPYRFQNPMAERVQDPVTQRDYVLIAGGGTTNAMLYDIAGRTFTTLPGLTTRRDASAAAVFPGAVLITGGADKNLNAVASAELFLLGTRRFYPWGSMQRPRYWHAMVALDSTTAVILCGTDGKNVFNDTELFFGALNRSVALPYRFGFGRANPQAMQLGDGSILVAGGHHDQILWPDRQPEVWTPNGIISLRPIQSPEWGTVIQPIPGGAAAFGGGTASILR